MNIGPLHPVPDVDVIVVTYDRPMEIVKTVDALRMRLFYPAEKLHFLIADDHTPGHYLRDIFETRPFRLLKDVTAVPSTQNLGWGGNVNRALRFSKSKYIFQIEDDYVLKKKIDLMAAVALLELKPEIGMVRYRGTAGHHLIYHHMEADISGFVDDYREGMGLPGKMSYFIIDGGSPGLYIYSHGAHLKNRYFHQHYGMYPEQLDLGSTEEHYAHTVKDMMHENPGSPVICVQPDWVTMWLDDIGTSRQRTELDRFWEGNKESVKP